MKGDPHENASLHRSHGEDSKRFGAAQKTLPCLFIFFTFADATLALARHAPPGVHGLHHFQSIGVAPIAEELGAIRPI